MAKKNIGAVVVRTRGRVISQTGTGLNSQGQPTVPPTYPAIRTARVAAAVRKNK